MKFCKYCGRELQDGELCDCPDAIADRNANHQVNTGHSEPRREVFETSNVNQSSDQKVKVGQPENNFNVNNNSKANNANNNANSNTNEQVTINIDVKGIKETVKSGLKAFRNPYTYGERYIKSLDYKNSFILMLVSALATALFALVICSKLNRTVNLGISGVTSMLGGGYRDYNAIPLGRAFFLSILYSLIVSLLVAASYFVANLIFKVGTNFEQAMAFSALRATYTTPIKLIASILGFLFIGLGVPVFFMSSLLASPLISASIFSSRNINNDKAAKASMIVRILFMIIFFAVARRGAPNFINAELLDSFRDSIGSSLLRGIY